LCVLATILRFLRPVALIKKRGRTLPPVTETFVARLIDSLTSTTVLTNLLGCPAAARAPLKSGKQRCSKLQSQRGDGIRHMALPTAWAAAGPEAFG